MNRLQGKVAIITGGNAGIHIKKPTMFGYVLETGKVGLEGPSADLMHNDHIKKLYLGA